MNFQKNNHISGTAEGGIIKLCISSPGSSPGTAAPMRRDQLLLQMSVSSLILDIALYSHVGLRGL